MMEVNERLKSEMTDLKSRSMRDNLVFLNVPEIQQEKQSDTEKVLSEFLVRELQMDQTEVNIKFDAVHRFGRLDKKPRKIVAKFSSRKDKERVKSEARKNRNSNFKVFDQYPEEVVRERQRLVPIMKAVRDKGNDAYITYNKLIVNGRPYAETGGRRGTDTHRDSRQTKRKTGL